MKRPVDYRKLAKKLVFWWVVWAGICFAGSLAYATGAEIYHQPPVNLWKCWWMMYVITFIGPTAIVLANFDWWGEEREHNAPQAHTGEEGAEEAGQEGAPRGDEAATQAEGEAPQHS